MSVRSAFISRLEDIGIENGFDELSTYTPKTGLWSMQSGKVICAATGHYSWDKACDVLGIGAENLHKIDVDSSFRMNLIELNRILDGYAEEKKSPVICVVGVFGSTEEGSVDDIARLASIRKKFSERGLHFFFHVDAAYGGYARSIFVSKEGKERARHTILKEYDWPSEEVFGSQFGLRVADSVTIDPHKLGYVPYPAGAIIYRDKRWEELTSVRAPYIIHTTDQSVRTPHTYLGQYTLEGSRPGAAAAAVYLAHKVLPLDETGYGHLIRESVKGIQQLYLRLVGQTSVTIADGCTVLIKPLCKPDLNILCFIVNRKGNYSLHNMNRLNGRIYQEFTYRPADPISTHKFFISETEFPRTIYKDSMLPILSEIGIDKDEYRRGDAVKILRMTLMHPWYDIQKEGNMVSEFFNQLVQAVGRIRSEEPDIFY